MLPILKRAYSIFNFTKTKTISFQFSVRLDELYPINHSVHYLDFHIYNQHSTQQNIHWGRGFKFVRIVNLSRENYIKKKQKNSIPKTTGRSNRGTLLSLVIGIKSRWNEWSHHYLRGGDNLIESYDGQRCWYFLSFL